MKNTIPETNSAIMYRLLAALSFCCCFFDAHAQFHGLIVNEFSQGNTANREYIELLVVGDRSCTDSTADLRGWIVDDQNGWYGATNGAPGHYRFANHPNWSAIPFGSLIVLYHAGDKNLSISAADDVSDANNDHVYIVPIDNSPNFMEQYATAPDNNSGPGYVYPPSASAGGYGPTASQWPFILALNNGGDVISAVSPANGNTAFFSIGFGYGPNPGFQSPTVGIASVPGGYSAFLSGSAYTLASSWIVSAVPANETPGFPNDPSNAAWISQMLQPGSLPAPVVTVNQTNCFSPTGGIIVTMPNGLGYSFSVDGVDYSNTWGVFTGLVPGSYQVTARNAAGCTSLPTFITINPQPVTPAAPQLVMTQPDCGQPFGTILITSPLGSGLQYSIDGINYQPSPVFTNLGPSLYGVSVQDSTGSCNSSATIVAIDPPPPGGFTVSVNGLAVCPGTTAVLTAATSVPGAYSYSWSVPAGAVDPGNVSSFSTAIPGLYTVSVSGSGCSVTDTGMVSLISMPAVTADDQLLCQNESVTLTAQPGGGTWTGANISGSVFDATGLAAGSYVADYLYTSSGCTVADQAVITVAATPQQPMLQLTQPGCTAGAGSIVVTSPTGASYTYNINGSPFQATTVFNLLAPGNYIVGVQQSGCSSFATATIDPAPQTPPIPTISVTQPDCVDPLGSITVTAPPGLEYSLDGISFSSVSVFSGLSPGSYQVYAQDPSGCISPPATATVTPASTGFTVALAGGFICGGDSFQMVAGVSPPSSSYSFLWTVPAGLGNPGNVAQFYSDVAGSYTVVVTDASGCSETATADLQAAAGNIQTVDRSVCNNDTVHLQAMPAAAQGYWAGPGVSGFVFDAANLAVGSHTVYYIDPSNTQCPQGTPATITVRAVPAAPVITVVDHCNGSSTLTASPGDSLLWSNGATSASITVNSAGVFTVSQTEDGCISPLASAQASPGWSPAPPTVTLVQPDCQLAVGTINIMQPLPGPGNSYSIDGADYSNTSGNFSGVLPGSYQVTVQEGNCISTATLITIDPAPSAPPSPVTIVTQPSCSHPLGSVLISSPTGANMLYSYDGQNFQSSALFDSLVPGSYQFIAQNSAGCLSLPAAVSVDPPTGAVHHPVIACIAQGQSYSFNGQSLSAGGYYSASYTQPGACDSVIDLYLVVTQQQVQLLEGCGSVSYDGISYTANAVIVDTIKSLVSFCDSIILTTTILVHPPLSTQQTICLAAGQSYFFNGMPVSTTGHYEDTLVSATGCDSIIQLDLMVETVQSTSLSACGQLLYNGVSYTADTTLSQTIHSLVTGCDSVTSMIHIKVHPVPSINPLNDTVICRGDTATLTAVAPGSTIAWTGYQPGSTIVVAPYAAASYQVIATSPAGCRDTAAVSVGIHNFQLHLQASANPVVIGTPVTLQAQSSSSFQVVEWRPAGLFVNQQAIVQNLMMDSALTAMVIGISPEGCLDSASVTILPDAITDIYIPNAFTPDGDGKNDLFRVMGGDIKAMDLRIFNRWGEMIFHSTDRARGWNGSYAGRPQPTGTYVYTIVALLGNGSRIARKGSLTLIR